MFLYTGSPLLLAQPLFSNTVLVYPFLNGYPVAIGQYSSEKYPVISSQSTCLHSILQTPSLRHPTLLHIPGHIIHLGRLFHGLLLFQIFMQSKQQHPWTYPPHSTSLSTLSMLPFHIPEVSCTFLFLFLVGLIMFFDCDCNCVVFQNILM